jgi:hypothetical protein
MALCAHPPTGWQRGAALAIEQGPVCPATTHIASWSRPPQDHRKRASKTTPLGSSQESRTSDPGPLGYHPVDTPEMPSSDSLMGLAGLVAGSR